MIVVFVELSGDLVSEVSRETLTFARSLSSHPEQRAAASALPGPELSGGDVLAGEDAAAFIEQVRLALYASKIVAYSQGFDEIRAGAAQYGWNIDLGAVSKIWRGGCRRRQCGWISCAPTR